MKKILISIIPFLIISFITCEAEDTTESPLIGWWKLQYIKKTPSGGTEEIENFPTIKPEEWDGDGKLESITFQGYMNILKNGSNMHSQTFIHVIKNDDPPPLCNCLLPVDYVGHCNMMDSTFTADGNNLIYTIGGPDNGSAVYTYENNILIIKMVGSEGSYEEWSLIKLGSAPVSPDNASDQSCE